MFEYYMNLGATVCVWLLNILFFNFILMTLKTLYDDLKPSKVEIGWCDDYYKRRAEDYKELLDINKEEYFRLLSEYRKDTNELMDENEYLKRTLKELRVDD